MGVDDGGEALQVAETDEARQEVEAVRLGRSRIPREGDANEEGQQRQPGGLTDLRPEITAQQQKANDHEAG